MPRPVYSMPDGRGPLQPAVNARRQRRLRSYWAASRTGAEGDARLVPVLADDFAHPMDYWLLARPEAWRNPAVRAVHEALAAT